LVGTNIETNIDDKNTTGERIDSNNMPHISMRVKFSSTGGYQALAKR
jgi:hypothetical protein